jgi:hypothetical protein
MNIIGSQFIPIRELPECYHKNLLLEMAVDEEVSVQVVAVAGCDNDWACYIGFPTRLADIKPERRSTSIARYVEHVSQIADVARSGDKLDADTAVAIFPVLAKSLRYRR